MGEEKKGIQETLEVLKALQDVAGDVHEVLADDKVDVKDLITTGPKLVGQMGDFVAAAKDIKNVPAELKDLDQEEINQLAAAALGIVSAARGA